MEGHETVFVSGTDNRDVSFPIDPSHRKCIARRSATEYDLAEIVIGTFQDITERKRAEETLRESESNCHAFFESMTDMTSVATLDGRLLFANAARRDTLGYTLDEVRSMHLRELHAAADSAEAQESHASISRGDREV